MTKRIVIEHSNTDLRHWDYFYTEIIDNSKPDGYKICASASGEWSFISRVVSDWLKNFKE
jgi:hypothetical protein